MGLLRNARRELPDSRGRAPTASKSTLAVGAAATLPAVLATLRAVEAGILPAGDRAVIAMRALAVLTPHPPLTGQYSASSAITGHPTYSLGPLLYWLLAIPARLGPPSAPSIVMAAVNVAAIMAVVALTRRRGGVALTVACSFALVLMSRSWSPETLHDIWNPAAGLCPLTLVLFLCWSVACGEYRLLPVTAVAASFTVQTQLTFLAPTLASGAVGLGGLALWRWERARAGRPASPTGPDAVDRSPVPRVWPWALAAFVLLICCWAAPLIDQLEHSPGNLSLVARAAQAHEPKQGPLVGGYAVVRAVGLPPWWLTVAHGPFARFAELRSAPDALAVVSTLALLGFLLLMIPVSLIRRWRTITAGCLIALAVCLALAADAAATPADPSLAHSLGYTMWWGSLAGMWVWLMAGVCAARLVSRIRPPVAVRLAGKAGGLVVPTAIILLVACAGVVAAEQGADQDQRKYRQLTNLNSRLLAVFPHAVHTVLLLGVATQPAFDIRAAAGFALRRDGLEVLDPAAAVRVEPYHRLSDTPQALVCVNTVLRARAGGKTIGTFKPRGMPTLAVTLYTGPVHLWPRRARCKS